MTLGPKQPNEGGNVTVGEHAHNGAHSGMTEPQFPSPNGAHSSIIPGERRLALRLVGLARPHVPRLVAAAVCMLLATAAFLAVPAAIRLLTDSVFVHHDQSALNRLALELLGLVAASALFGFGRGYLLAQVSGRIVADLRQRLYQQLLSLSLSFYDDHRSGDLMSRLTTDTTLVQTVVSNSLLSLLQQVVMIVAIMVIVLILDWRLALVTLILAPVVAAIGTVVGRRTRKLSERAQERLGASNVVLEETLSSMRVVKAFLREAFELARYREAVEGSYGAGLEAARLRSGFEAVMVAASLSAFGGVLWFGGREVLAGRLTAGGLISFLFYLTLLLGPLGSLASLYGEFQSAIGAATRMFEILDTPPTISDAPDAYPLSEVAGRVEAHDISFRYAPETPEVLHHIAFSVGVGQTVAIVGPSGAGKTTLLSLLPRFYQPTSGFIAIDGHDTAEVTIASLRAAIGIVPQETVLFGGTVRENIAYGRLDATDYEIEAAARRANAHDFISVLPHSYDSLVGDRGVKLSAGQRQRIAIARALLKDPRILILDEATSALDNESESLVQDALEQLMVGRTTFVIAHRLTTIEKADLILVLDAGRIVEQGDHAELMGYESLYRRLYTRAFGDERVMV